MQTNSGDAAREAPFFGQREVLVIIVVEKPIDIANYVQVAYIHHKEKSPRVYHYEWASIPPPPQPEKLYLVGHGGQGTLGDFSPIKLADFIADLDLVPKASKIILSGCHTGESMYIADVSKESQYCLVFAARLYQRTKMRVPVVGLSGTSTRFPDGSLRVVDPKKNAERAEIRSKALGTEGKKKKDKLSDGLKAMPTPATSEALIECSQRIARFLLSLDQDPETTFRALWTTVMSEQDSKVYVSKVKIFKSTNTLDVDDFFT